jgi:hypothetical protein
MMAKHVNLAVNVTIGARPFSERPPALGTFGHVLTLQFKQGAAFHAAIEP